MYKILLFIFFYLSFHLLMGQEKEKELRTKIKICGYLVGSDKYYYVPITMRDKKSIRKTKKFLKEYEIYLYHDDEQKRIHFDEKNYEFSIKVSDSADIENIVAKETILMIFKKGKKCYCDSIYNFFKKQDIGSIIFNDLCVEKINILKLKNDYFYNISNRTIKFKFYITYYIPEGGSYCKGPLRECNCRDFTFIKKN